MSAPAEQAIAEALHFAECAHQQQGRPCPTADTRPTEMDLAQAAAVLAALRSLPSADIAQALGWEQVGWGVLSNEKWTLGPRWKGDKGTAPDIRPLFAPGTP